MTPEEARELLHHFNTSDAAEEHRKSYLDFQVLRAILSSPVNHKMMRLCATTR